MFFFGCGGVFVTPPTGFFCFLLSHLLQGLNSQCFCSFEVIEVLQLLVDESVTDN